jgi:hypothetical protein
VLVNPYFFGRTALYAVNPQLANPLVLPVLELAQPVLLPLVAITALAYAFTKRGWIRTALLIALWAVAIEWLFSVHL